MQNAPAASVDPQLLVPLNAKYVGLDPARLMTMLLSGALPTLVITVLIDVVVVPSVVVGNASDVGLNETAGAVIPAPDRLTRRLP